MTQDFSLWKHQVRRAIDGLRTLDFRRAADAPAPGFSGAMQALYGESHFAEFLAYKAWRQAGLDEAAGRALYALQEKLDAYDEPDNDAAMVADPAWWAIRTQAFHVAALLA